MATWPWLDDVYERLVQSGLPQAYIRRFMDELADHYEDLLTENASMDAKVLTRLGNPEDVAAAAVLEHRKRSFFFQRHPAAAFWVFGVSPVVSLALAFVLACLGVVGCGTLCGHWDVNLADSRHLGAVDPVVLAWIISSLTTILPALALAILYGRFARRCEIGVKWMLVPCVTLALMAMLPFQGMELSESPGASRWTIGLGVPTGPVQCVQLLVPLAVGGWFAWRAGRDGKNEDRMPAMS